MRRILAHVLVVGPAALALGRFGGFDRHLYAGVQALFQTLGAAGQHRHLADDADGLQIDAR